MMPLRSAPCPTAPVASGRGLIAAPASVGVTVSASSRSTATICPESLVPNEIVSPVPGPLVNAIAAVLGSCDAVCCLSS